MDEAGSFGRPLEVDGIARLEESWVLAVCLSLLILGAALPLDERTWTILLLSELDARVESLA